MLEVQNNKIAAVILAAGEGKRMKSDLPKVMHLLNGRPMIDHIVSSVEKLNVDKIICVVSKKHTLVQEYLGNRSDYVTQEEQKGTGHAVLCTEPNLKDTVDEVLVLNGDIPCVSTASLQKILKNHINDNNILTLATVIPENFFEWRSVFTMYGRVTRSLLGKIEKIVEFKDASEEQKNIRELNAGIYCFKAEWLFEHLRSLQLNNAQGEYYLTDLIKMALDEGQKVSSVEVDPKEVVGVSTQEDLKLVSSLLPNE